MKEELEFTEGNSQDTTASSCLFSELMLIVCVSSSLVQGVIAVATDHDG